MSRSRPRAEPALLVRGHWDARSPYRAFDPGFRLGCRGAFPEGLTDEERQALRRVARGEVVAGLESVDAATAREALAYPWLRPKR